MKVQSVSTLRKVKKSIVQAEMDARAEESIEATRNGDTLSLDEFKKENR